MEIGEIKEKAGTREERKVREGNLLSSNPLSDDPNQSLYRIPALLPSTGNYETKMALGLENGAKPM